VARVSEKNLCAFSGVLGVRKRFGKALYPGRTFEFIPDHFLSTMKAVTVCNGFSLLHSAITTISPITTAFSSFSKSGS
jgi:hypothetical protein